MIIITIMATSRSFSRSFSSVIRGHHASKAVWTPTLEEVLDVACESDNAYDSHAVAILKMGVGIIGHAPREHSRVFWSFLEGGGSISCRVNGARQLGKGLEVPCLYVFNDNGSKKIRRLLKKLPKASFITEQHTITS